MKDASRTRQLCCGARPPLSKATIYIFAPALARLTSSYFIVRGINMMYILESKQVLYFVVWETPGQAFPFFFRVNQAESYRGDFKVGSFKFEQFVFSTAVLCELRLSGSPFFGWLLTVPVVG
jgi:hypothetical protein